MATLVNRRRFLATVAAAATAGPSLATIALEQKTPPARGTSPFQVSVFTDEMMQDFARACEIVSKEFGLSYVELRGMWDKNIVDLNERQINETRDILRQFDLGVTCISGPLYKVDWPGAPRSKHSPPKPQFNATADWGKQDAVLDREIELAGIFNTKHIRCFDFWRLDDPAPYRAAMDEKLMAAAEKAARSGLTLVMENEHACNTATAKEAVRTLAAVNHPAFKLIWDPGNSAYAGERAYPDGYKLLPKDRIGHVHCKNAKKKADGSLVFTSMAGGVIDYEGQFAALKQDGYTGPVVLETHWKLDGSAEKGTRQCMTEMKEQLRKAGALS
ncbi:MAG: sugar phosphate isomerase/epimerase family protein [Candidatus Sumerlaeaceae bacterium]